MSRIQMVSGFLALAVSASSAFAQATAVSPSLPQGHRMILACDNKANPSKYGSLSAVPGSGNKTEYALVFRDLAHNAESIMLVRTTKEAAAQKVQDYCDGVFTPAKKVPYYTGLISR